jgi:hypothetical protein
MKVSTAYAITLTHFEYIFSLHYCQIGCPSSTRVRFCVGIALQLHAGFAYKDLRIIIILRTPITAACQHIFRKNQFKTK